LLSLTLVGGSMSRIKAWDDIVEKLQSRLSKWKINTLLAGGRLTLVKSVLSSSPIYYMSMYKIPSQVLKHLEGVRHNFFIGVDHSKKEKNMAWFKWSRALVSKEKGGVCNGRDTRFWEDVWRGDMSFKSCFPRVYALETDKKIFVADKLNHNVADSTLRRLPRNGVEIDQYRALTNILECSRQQKFLVLRFFDVKEQQGIDRLNIEKLDGNIVQKHEGSKQVGFKQLGPGVETGVHEVSNDDTVVAQRRLEDKQPEENTSTNCLVKEQEKVHHGADVGAVIMKTGVPGQEGAKGNVVKMYREDNKEAAFAVAVVDKIYAHESLTFNDTVACEAIFKWKAGLKEDMDVQSDVTKDLLVRAKRNVLGLEIIRDQSGNTLRVSQSRIHNEKLVQSLLKRHSTLSLEDSLSGDCDVE
ncbi:hypothetical protein Tco_0999808, partial [Tanacetum coccineum]